MEVALLCAYAGLLVHLSRQKGDRRNEPGLFFVNNRASGRTAVALSLIVSCVGASATMGMAGMAFDVGTPAFWWLGAGAAGITLLAVLLAAKVRESGCLTMPEMVGGLLGKGSRPLVSAIIVTAWTAILAAQFAALSRLLEALTGFAALPCLAVGFALVVVHTLGGQAVIMRTDRLQAYILFAGLAILLLWLNQRNPGWAGAVTLEAVNDKFQPADLVRLLFVVGGNYLVCPMLFGRFLSARDATTAKRGGILAGLGLLGCAALIVAVGLSCRGLIAPDTPADAVLTTAIDSVFPRWLAVLVLLALVSAVVSSADSCLVTSATVLGHDLLGTDKPSHCRAAVLLLGCLGAGMTFMQRGILDFLFMAYDMYVAGVVMPVFVALLLSRRARARPSFAMAAIGGGGALGILSAALAVPGLSMAGMAFSTLATLAGMRRRTGE